jgi:hypothetical protein
MKRKEKMYVVKIITTNKEKEWHYLPNSEILIPVLATTSNNARIKVENRCWGSEYPNYEFVEIQQCDYFLFSPII